MTTVPHDHQCSRCSKSYVVQQAWIDPQQFTKPEEAFLTKTFWCPKCEEGQAVKIQMLEEKQLTVIEQLQYKGLINENSPSYYAPAKNKDEEENKDVEKITEKRVLEILSVLR